MITKELQIKSRMILQLDGVDENRMSTSQERMRSGGPRCCSGKLDAETQWTFDELSPI